MNLLVVPTFGIKAKCDMMRKMQDMYNKMYAKFESGFEGTTSTRSGDDGDENPELDIDIKRISSNMFRSMLTIIRRSRIELPDDRSSRYVNTRRPPPGFKYSEMLYASLLLGNLEKAQTDNRRHVESIYNKFRRNAEDVSTSEELVRLIEETRHIPGYDDTLRDNIVTLFQELVPTFSDPRTGPRTIALVTWDLFKRMRSARII